jgi:peroxiredoxin
MGFTRRASILTVLALVALSGATIALSLRVDKLLASYQRLGQRLALPYPGFMLPTFSAGTVSGDSIRVGPPGVRQLIFEFNASCPYCRATLPIWKVLADSARRLHGTVEVIGLSLDSFPLAREHATGEGLNFHVATFPTQKMRRLSRAGTVPQTLVLDDDGLVIYAHAGLLTAAILDSVYRVLEWRPPSDSTKQTPTAAAAERR